MLEMFEKSKVFDLKDEINIRNYQIVSKKLVNNEEITFSMFSFDKDESVSEQSNSEDIIIFVLEGNMSVTHKKVFTAEKNQVLAIPKNTLHRVYSNEKSKIIQLSFISTKGDEEMEKFINKINHGEILNMADVLSYEDGGIASIALVQRESLTLTLFAFDKGQSIASHSSNGDALVQVLEGEVTIDIDGEKFDLQAGKSIIMPAGTPHAVSAKERFKMMLTVVKPL